jgi:hypothetical protein
VQWPFAGGKVHFLVNLYKHKYMSAAELKELRRGAKKYLDQADERVLRMVYALLKADAEYEMECRFAELENGSVQGYSLEETQVRARQAYKARSEKEVLR